MKLAPIFSILTAATCLLSCGCSLFPETRHRDSLHNPFPQLKRIAVLPFINQSQAPTLDTDQVTSSYYAALQAIPGFEVMPLGVVKTRIPIYIAETQPPPIETWGGKEIQQLARYLGVEAVVVGSVTDFDPYYPPRMGISTNWYAANEGFHPIPAGYGLPWGTDAEKQIPRRVVREAEFELARSQLATQAPTPVVNQSQPNTAATMNPLRNGEVRQVQAMGEMPQTIELAPPALDGQIPMDKIPSANITIPGQQSTQSNLAGDGNSTGSTATELLPGPAPHNTLEPLVTDQYTGDFMASPLPANWPEPTDLIPDPPVAVPPKAIANHDPVLSHTRIYRGDDSYFTNRLADFVETGDDSRPAGWQGYLKRSEDFIRFCCHLHITEMLESRGGTDQTDLILRWPLSRY